MPARLEFGLALVLLVVSFPAISLADPAQDATPEVLYQQARTAEAAGDIKTAAEKYERIVSLRPDLAEAYANLGRLYYQRQQWEQASNCLQKAIKLKPELAGPHFFLGVMAFDSRQYDEALRSLKKAQSLDASQMLTALYLGYTDFALHNYLDAVQDFRKAEKVQKDDENVLYYLSTSYGQAAKHYYGVLQETYPESFYTHLTRAHAFESLGDWQGAKKEYTAALALEPQNLRVKERLTWSIQNETGKPTGSPPAAASDPEGEMVDGSLKYLYAPHGVSDVRDELARYERLIVPENRALPVDKIYSLGENYQILAYLTSLRLLDVAPDSYRAHQLKARFYAEMNQPDEAEKEYHVAEKLRPDLPELHFEIGDFYWGKDRVSEALPELQQELRIQPNHPEALYEVGDILFSQGKLPESEQYLRRALKVDSGMVAAHLALERIYTTTGKYDQSVAELETVFKLAPKNPTPHYRMAMVLRKMGQREQAQHELAVFVSLGSKVGIQQVDSATARDEGKP